ncbi:MAG: hypothetical protein ACRDJM_02435 [Actinomycetota bacterium]
MRASVVPNTGLVVGSKITIELNFTSNGKAYDDLSAHVNMPDGILWRVDEKPPGAILTGASCSEAPEGVERCGPNGVQLEGVHVDPGGSRTLNFVLTVQDMRCPGFGDFVTEIYSGHSGGVLSGPNSFLFWLLFENDWEDYVKAKRTRGDVIPPREDHPCDPLRVEVNP